MQSSHLSTLALFILFSTFTIVLSLPHALPYSEITKRTITFRRTSIHFPTTSHFRSFLPSSGQQLHNLFPSHSQKSKTKKDTTSTTTTSTVTTKPFSFTIWNILSHPETALNGTDGDTGKEPTAAELSIFKGGVVGNGKGKGRVRRTFGFLRSAVPWGKVEDEEILKANSGVQEQGDGKDSEAVKEEKKKESGGWMTAHGDGHKHSHKQPQPQTSTQPSPPLRISMAGFKSWFDDAKAKEDGMEAPPQNALQKWFGWGKKD